MIFTIAEHSDLALARCFFDFFRTASCETYGSESIFRLVTSNNALETYHSVRDIPQKVGGEKKKQKKKKKRQAIASAGSEALGSPGEAWDASGLPKQGSGAALGGF